MLYVNLKEKKFFKRREVYILLYIHIYQCNYSSFKVWNISLLIIGLFFENVYENSVNSKIALVSYIPCLFKTGYCGSLK